MDLAEQRTRRDLGGGQPISQRRHWACRVGATVRNGDLRTFAFLVGLGARSISSVRPRSDQVTCATSSPISSERRRAPAKPIRKRARSRASARLVPQTRLSFLISVVVNAAERWAGAPCLRPTPRRGHCQINRFRNDFWQLPFWTAPDLGIGGSQTAPRFARILRSGAASEVKLTMPNVSCR